MNSTKDKIKGQANTAAGSIKLAAGKIAGNEKLKLQGMTQKIKGEAQKTSGKVKETIKGGFKNLGDSVKNISR